MLDATPIDPCPHIHADDLRIMPNVHLYAEDGDEEYHGDAYFEIGVDGDDGRVFFWADLQGILISDDTFVDGAELGRRCDSLSISELEDMMALELGQ
ncbi:MAG: hypothetical protein AAGK66_07330 [Pseudomonadota bacterium]